MRVYYECRPVMSKAMHRVRDALVSRAPQEVTFVKEPMQADVRFIEAIGADAMAEALPGQAHVYLQYCMASAGGTPDAWKRAFKAAALVASYLDIPNTVGGGDFNFMRMPLGVSSPFVEFYDADRATRPYAVLTSGYVAIQPGEAIAACYEAASSLGMRTYHLGPQEPAGMPPTRPHLWHAEDGISDGELAEAYANSRFVSGLRWVEGFELPALEGALCGAVPIMFDLPCYRHWFEGIARFVQPDQATLHHQLALILRDGTDPVPAHKRALLEMRHSWDYIASQFWSRVCEAVRTEVWA
jgi:hypothetical protein